MSKESSLTIKICDWVTKYSIYALVFLLPVFFLPWTSEVLDFNKQAVLLFLVFISLFFWMLKVLVSGKLQLNFNKIHIFAGFFLVVYLLSAIFSVDKYGSFWGWPRVTAEGLVTVIGLLALYFVVSSALLKNEAIKSIYVLSASVFIAQLIGAFQLFGKNPTFNTLGGVGSMGIFSAVLLPLMIIMLIISEKWWKILFILEIVLSGLIIALINFPVVWWAVILGSAVVMIFGVFKRNLFDGRWMALPMFFLAISVFFLVLNPQINWFLQRTSEIYLSRQANFQIGMSVLKEKPVLGSGPGTFSYDFSKFKPVDFNKTAIWNVAFNTGSSKIMTIMATGGILGLLAILAFMASIIFFGIRSFFKSQSVLGLGLFASLSVLILSFFLHNSNLSLDFVFFFLTAVLTALIFEQKKEFELKPSSLTTLIITFAFTLMFIFGLGLLILGGQRYVAEVRYFLGIKALSENRLDEGIKNLEKAMLANAKTDLYYRQLAQVYLLKIEDIAKNETMSEDDKSKALQVLVANSVNAAKIASDLNPNNTANWLIRGYVYQSLAGLITDGNTWAINSYNEALKLDPNNPYLLTQRGIAYYQVKDYQNAKSDFQKALELKPDYQNAQDGIKAIEGPETSSDETGAKK